MFEFSKLIKVYRPYIGSIILIPISILVVVFGLYPASLRVYSMYTEYSQLQDDVALLNAKRVQVRELNDNNLLENLQIASSMIPTEKSVQTVMATVESVATRSNVELLELNMDSAGSISTQSATSNPKEDIAVGAFVLPFSVSVVGGFEQLNSFFDEIIAVRRLLRIEGYTMTVQGTGFQATVVLDALYNPLDAGRRDALAELVPLTQNEQTLLANIARLPDYTQLNTEAIIPPENGVEAVRLKSNPFSPF